MHTEGLDVVRQLDDGNLVDMQECLTGGHRAKGSEVVGLVVHEYLLAVLVQPIRI